LLHLQNATENVAITTSRPALAITSLGNARFQTAGMIIRAIHRKQKERQQLK
jgi:hypothetical protein